MALANVAGTDLDLSDSVGRGGGSLGSFRNAGCDFDGGPSGEECLVALVGERFDDGGLGLFAFGPAGVAVYDGRAAGTAARHEENEDPFLHFFSFCDRSDAAKAASLATIQRSMRFGDWRERSSMTSR